jgi:hypothetical protein
MRFQTKLIWTTVTMLALGAEGLAGAQPAPVRAGSGGEPTLAWVEQWSASVGPELAAARATLGGTTKKSDSGAPVDLDGLANRQAAAGNMAANGLTLPTDAGAPMQSSAAGGDRLQVLRGDATGATSTTAGPAIRVTPVTFIQDGGASTSAPPPHAQSVLRGQINPAAKSCYENDPDSKSKRPGRLVILIKLTPTGEVDSVGVSSNVGLSPSVASCITTAAGAAKFAAPAANSATVRAAFTFPAQEDLASPPAGRAIGAQAGSAPGRTSRDTLAKADTQPANADTAHR